ncbi:hypothetical protein DVS28_a1417 [Euzebya pacifica]|uniref:Uncharacterized protein n=1 Tax=Euzebya pacifica TaxID=1608957 RepID=A0A346XV69_9ACTN|nr:hypothetical protein DVS28_a1417 [Euzebya pacifica]
MGSCNPTRARTVRPLRDQSVTPGQGHALSAPPAPGFGHARGFS